MWSCLPPPSLLVARPLKKEPFAASLRDSPVIFLGVGRTSFYYVTACILPRNFDNLAFYLLGASKITENLYCNCVHLLGRLRDLQYIFAVNYETLCSKDNNRPSLNLIYLICDWCRSKQIKSAISL